LPEKQAQFVEHFANYGFHSSDELIVKALDLLQEDLLQYDALEASALLYAEIYDADEESKEWTESATKDWE
jgi:hypothetical protein